MAFRKSAVGTSNDTHTHTYWLMLGGGRNVFQTDPLSSAIGLVRTHTQAHVLCVHAWLFCHGCAFCVEWLPVWACCKGSRAKPFSFALPWSVCWLYHCSCSALCSLATIQFRQIPTGIWLKFLLNSQLNKQRQTVCPQSCLDRFQCAVGCPDINLKSRFKKKEKRKEITLTALTFASYAECLHVSFNRFFFTLPCSLWSLPKWIGQVDFFQNLWTLYSRCIITSRLGLVNKVPWNHKLLINCTEVWEPGIILGLQVLAPFQNPLSWVKHAGP